MCAATSQVPGDPPVLPSLGTHSPQLGSRSDFPPVPNFPDEIIEDFALGSEICPGGLMLLFLSGRIEAPTLPQFTLIPLKDVLTFLFLNVFVYLFFLTIFLLMHGLHTETYLCTVLTVCVLFCSQDDCDDIDF